MLSCREHREVHGLVLDEVDRLLRGCPAALKPVDVRFTLQYQLADPAKKSVLNAAVNGRAGTLVTHNGHEVAAASPFGVPPSGRLHKCQGSRGAMVNGMGRFFRDCDAWQRDPRSP